MISLYRLRESVAQVQLVRDMENRSRRSIYYYSTKQRLMRVECGGTATWYSYCDKETAMNYVKPNEVVVFPNQKELTTYWEELRPLLRYTPNAWVSYHCTFKKLVPYVKSIEKK